MQDDPFARAVERAHAAEQHQEATKRHRRQKQFSSGSRTLMRTHATVFLCVNLMLVAIFFTTTPHGYPWVLWPILGWGIGLAAHYAAVKDTLRPPPAPVQAVSFPPAPAPAAPAAPTPIAAAPTPTATATAAAPSTTDELTRLAELHRSGALDDDEFKAAKAKLLG